MVAECKEDALSTRTLLLDSRPNAGFGNCNIPTATGASSITFVLVLSTFVAVCGSFCYGCSVGYSSPAQSGIMEDLGLSVAAYSVFGSIVTIGGMMGAILSGKIADLVGRKRTMFLSQLFCTPGWIAIAFSEDAWLLDIGRFSVGFGVGLTTYVVPVYVAEITPKDLRGSFTLANRLMINCGFALVYFIGNFFSWRSLSLMATIPCITQIVGLLFIPESPRWLAKLGRRKDSEAALQLLRGRNVDVSHEAIEIRDAIEKFELNPGGATAFDLFQKRNIYPIAIGVGLMSLQQFGGISGVKYYAKTIFAETDFSPTLGTTAFSVIQVPLAVVGLLLMDVSGRRKLLMISSVGECLCLFFVGLSFLLKKFQYFKELTPVLASVGLMGYGGMFALGMSGIPWVIMSEIFPVNVKASAGSLVTFTNWICSWVVTYAINFMMQWSSAGTFFIFTGMCGITVLFVWKLVPETKGRTLEEIQASVTRFAPQVC